MNSFCTSRELQLHKELYAISEDKVGLVRVDFSLFLSGFVFVYVMWLAISLIHGSLGRLTLTNYALYFEASGFFSYEDAIKLDLSKDIEQSVKPGATGPLGSPLFDKAIIYESSEM